MVVSCDANGIPSVAESCPLGCFEAEARCVDVKPSNHLATFLDSSANEDDLILENVTIDTTSGQLRDSATGAVLPTRLSGLVPAPLGMEGAAIRVFVADYVSLNNVRVRGEPALAIVANGEVFINGTFSLWNDDDSAPMPGAVLFPSCMGIEGQTFTVSPQQFAAAGSGGGGHATPGKRGGDVGTIANSSRYAAGGAGGGASGSATLEPLRGGCGGGGAVQVTSRKRIKLGPSAIIDANGRFGFYQLGGPSSYGGGTAGGGILLEAPEVVLETQSRLLVNGGPGSSSGFAPVSLDGTASPGATCTSSSTYLCSNGGNGASRYGPATDGGNVPYQTGPSNFYAGGGGGGLGYIRINTRPGGGYIKAPDTIESGVVSEAQILTR